MNAGEEQALRDIAAILKRATTEEELHTVTGDLGLLADDDVTAQDVAKRWILDARLD